MTVLSDYIARMVDGGMRPDEAMQVAAELFAAGVASAAARPSAGALRTRKWRHKASQSVTGDDDKSGSEGVTKRHKASQSVTSDKAPLSSSNLDLRKKEGRGTRIDPDWMPDRDFAKQLGWSDAQIDTEAANFRDYWLGCAGSRGVKRDWLATWRKWIRSSRTKPAGSITGSVVNPDTVDWRVVLQSYKNYGKWPRGHGNDPTSPSCRAPPALLREYGFQTTQ
jgi:hypothetical protein